MGRHWQRNWRLGGRRRWGLRGLGAGGRGGRGRGLQQGRQGGSCRVGQRARRGLARLGRKGSWRGRLTNAFCRRVRHDLVGACTGRPSCNAQPPGSLLGPRPWPRPAGGTRQLGVSGRRVCGGGALAGATPGCRPRMNNWRCCSSVGRRCHRHLPVHPLPFWGTQTFQKLPNPGRLMQGPAVDSRPLHDHRRRPRQHSGVAGGQGGVGPRGQGGAAAGTRRGGL